MAKVQTGFYQKWRNSEIELSISSDTVLGDVSEIISVDVSLNTVKVTLPDTTSSEIVNGKEIWVFDSSLNAATFAIQIVPNPGDGTTIEGVTEVFIEEDNGAIIFQFLNNQWMILASADRFSRAIGAFTMIGNAAATVINTVNVYEDIVGTATGAALNSKFSFSTPPNELTYDGDVDVIVFGIVAVGARRDSGAAVRLTRYSAFKDDGGGFVEIPGATATIDTTNQIRSATLPIFTGLTNGDIIKVQVKNEDDTADILIADLSMIVFEVSS